VASEPRSCIFIHFHHDSNFLSHLSIPYPCPGGEERPQAREGHCRISGILWVIVSKGEAVRMDLILDNKGRTDETIDVKISTIPKGWKAQLKGASYLITGMYVPMEKLKIWP